MKAYFVVNPAGRVGLRNRMVQYLENFCSQWVCHFFKLTRAYKRNVIDKCLLFVHFLTFHIFKNQQNAPRNKIHRKALSYQVPAPTCFGAEVPSLGSFSATSFRRSNLLVFKNMKYDLFGHKFYRVLLSYVYITTFGASRL